MPFTAYIRQMLAQSHGHQSEAATQIAEHFGPMAFIGLTPSERHVAVLTTAALVDCLHGTSVVLGPKPVPDRIDSVTR